MNSILGFLGFLADEPLILSMLVFVAVFTAALLVARRFLVPRQQASRRPPSAADLARRASEPALPDGGVVVEDDAGPVAAEPLKFGIPDPFLGAKRVMHKVFRVLAALIIAVLLTLTFVSYRESTPGTGDVLFTVVLAAATVISFLHLMTMDRRLNPGRDPGLKAELDRVVRADFASKIQAALSRGATIKWEVAPPEVHRIDDKALELARAMSSEGRSMDEICRAVASDYAGWSPAHQQAFRNVMQAALDHS